jgi:hypothetical protein
VEVVGDWLLAFSQLPNANSQRLASGAHGSER